MSKILYLHGFASCGEGNKSLVLKHYFGANNVFASDLPSCPLDAIIDIETCLKSKKFDLVIGSSLGGFYAMYIAEKYHIKAVLLNPSTQPWITLELYIGKQKRFCDEAVFEFKAIYLEQLKTLKVLPNKGKYLVLLQSNDEVLDYTKALSLYNKHKVVVEYGGNHRFENIDEYISMIKKFIE